MRFEFATAQRVIFGEGAVREVPAAARAFGRRAILVRGASAERVAPLRAALEETADALANAHLNRLLDCEARIETALLQLPTHGLSADTRRVVMAEMEFARAALTRCRRLGLALDEFIRLGMAAQGLGSGYGRTVTTPPIELHSLNTRA